jgi:hypothetical protein
MKVKNYTIKVGHNQINYFDNFIARNKIIVSHIATEFFSTWYTICMTKKDLTALKLSLHVYIMETIND